ncbi:helicase HerA-like domain-containing protein [Jatrophihabitans sp.]|uniref:helicase HerA-like domain-containing protein n=1 Tax=Jatrophihabitans sp. TaxID=1932789 RepID=UPI002C937C6F|nr:helicase HerA-like domain-containing protein [Jatrophihabitans sp.]
MAESSTESATSIAAGYDFGTPALELGSVVVGGEAFPSAGVRIPLSMLNRHGLIAGATGTGKTKTLQLLTEQLSAAGVPVVVADIKGDLSGLASPAQPAQPGDRVSQRAADTGDDWQPAVFPVEFLALGGLGSGVPVRATMTSFGPLLLAKVLELNETQESSLALIFHYADSAGLPLLDLKDLRALIQYLTSDEGQDALTGIGGLSKATAGVILRSLITLENNGGEVFFGEPEWEPADLIRTGSDGRGIVSALELAAVQDKPRLFSTFLMWLLADLFSELPEVGDVDKPKLVFFLDEAHLLFSDASKAFLEQLTQTVRLIRSKGIGIFFVTQVPADVPDSVLGQLGNRVQHALRAFTPDDAANLAKAVRTYPKTSHYDLAELLTQLGIGEAVVTVLSERGAPTPVAWTRLRAPRSLMAQLDQAAQAQAVAGSPLLAKYGTPIDRDSAYEKLTARLAAAHPEPAPAQPEPAPAGGSADRAPSQPKQQQHDGGVVAEVLGSAAFRSFARSTATVLGREITRSLFGTARRRRR